MSSLPRAEIIQVIPEVLHISFHVTGGLSPPSFPELPRESVHWPELEPLNGNTISLKHLPWRCYFVGTTARQLSLGMNSVQKPGFALLY